MTILVPVVYLTTRCPVMVGVPDGGSPERKVCLTRLESAATIRTDESALNIVFIVCPAFNLTPSHTTWADPTRLPTIPFLEAAVTHVQPWRFVDASGAFVLENPQQTSYLYFPLVNEHGMMSAITPTLHGDIKTGQNTFLMPPVSVEDLHTSRSARNFWVMVDGFGAWSATGNSAPQIAASDDPASAEHVTLEAGFLWHTITRENDSIELRARITNVVPASRDQVELMKVSLTNTGNQPLALTPTAAIPIYGRSADNLRDHRHVTSLLHRTTLHTHGVLVRPTLSFDERGHTVNTVTYGVLGAEADGTPPVMFYPLVEDFIGEGGSLDWPRAVVRPNVPGLAAGQPVDDGYETIGALRFAPITLAPGETREYVLILAIIPENANADALVQTYASAALFDTMLARCQDVWRAKIDTLVFYSGDPTFDRWMKWVVAQPVLRRLFGNSFLPYHDYGRGGRGWRDLWQDCLALLFTEPDEVASLLLSSYAGVRLDGSNATIIGTRPGEFLADRNNIPRVWMDHGAWPFLTTRLYIDQSGDLAFLLRDQAYFKDSHIYRVQAHDDRWTPEQGTQQRTTSGDVYRGTVLEHILVQHLTAFFNVGEHNIIKLEGADWNDGMDMAHQRGESVAFTALYASNLRALSDLVLALESRGMTEVALAAELGLLLDTLSEAVDYDDVAAKQQRLMAYFATCEHVVSGEQHAVSVTDLTRDLAAKADWLTLHLRRQEWVTDESGRGWFNGYYDDNGQRVEGVQPDGVRMTLTGQVFTLMGGIATGEQAHAVTQAADHYLLEPSMGGYRLNTDFGGVQLTLGRCFGFAFGHKENGAMFSHMAVMYANALYRRGLVQAGHRVLNGIFQHCCDFATSRMYPGIPEYLSARGRGMYPYLTGSASWLLFTLVTEAYGIKGVLGDLCLEPKLVREQFDANGDAAISTRFAGRQLEVVYHNPSHHDYGAYAITSVLLDGGVVSLKHEDRAVVIERALISALDNNLHRLDVKLE